MMQGNLSQAGWLAADATLLHSNGYKNTAHQQSRVLFRKKLYGSEAIFFNRGMWNIKATITFHIVDVTRKKNRQPKRSTS